MSANSFGTNNTMYYPIFVFSIFVFVLFVFILSISVSQYLNYKVVDGTAFCSEELDRCNLKFSWTNSNGETVNEQRVTSFDTIGQNGVFSVEVAYTVNDDGNSIDRYLVIGSPKYVYLGTQTYIIVYSILSFLSLIVIMLMIPYHHKKK
jgi:hypothetical protein